SRRMMAKLNASGRPLLAQLFSEVLQPFHQRRYLFFEPLHPLREWLSVGAGFSRRRRAKARLHMMQRLGPTRFFLTWAPWHFDHQRIESPEGVLDFIDRFEGMKPIAAAS